MGTGLLLVLGVLILLTLTTARTLLLLIPLAFASWTSWSIGTTCLRTKSILSSQSMVSSTMISILLTDTATDLANSARLRMIREQLLNLTSLFSGLPGA